jgi:AcrR family transcriptional regulator
VPRPGPGTVHVAFEDPAPETAGPAERPRGRGRPKRDQAEQLNRDLLELALDHFLERGFEGASVNAITSALGMSKRTVYAWYGDKLSLFRAALQRAVDDWAVSDEELAALETDDLEETLVRVADLFVRNMLTPAGLRLIRITNAESYRMPEIGAYLHERGSRPIMLFLRDLFRRKLPAGAGEPADIEALATAFLHLTSGPARLSAWGFAIDATGVQDFVRQRVRLFLHGVLHR